MQAARSGANSSNNQLGLLIGNQRWLLSLDEAGEIVAASGITKVPLTQDWYLGLTNIRGTLISVIDFARFQGQPKTVVDKDTRIVAFSNALAFYSALLVDRVLGLRNVEEMVLQPGLLAADYPVGAEHTAAETGETVARTAPAQYLDSESQLWTELKLTQVVSDPRFLHIGL
ncbi:chemotaxis protein CheW [Glaciimonas immobilis]|nr:chemotaxis protein CheW [Glaciimonas immobilis]